MMHSLQHILCVALRAFLNCESAHGTADLVIALSPPRCSFLEISLLLLCVLQARHQHAHRGQLFGHQTPVVVQANLMSFVLTAAVKGHQEEYRIIFNSRAWWKRIPIGQLL